MCFIRGAPLRGVFLIESVGEQLGRIVFALGREEIDVIAPAVVELQGARGASATIAGPFSPDTIFHHAAQGDWDAVLCMYHDQGLIPLKLHAFHEGVNVTLGLPFPRTSPDHGTAFDIAGLDRADPRPMAAAIRMAAEAATLRADVA